MRSAALLCPLLLAAPLMAVAAPAQAAPAPGVISAKVSAAQPKGVDGDRRVGLKGAHAETRRTTMKAGPLTLPSEVSVVGVTWDEGTGASASVSYRVERAGTWGPWTRADVELCSDCGTSGTPKRAGSEPVVVTGGQRVEVRLVATGAENARLTVIDPEATTPPAAATPFAPSAALHLGASPAGSGMSASGARAATPAGTSRVKRIKAPAGLAAPRISTPIKRTGWRATPTAYTSELGAPRGVVVHHTAGTNNYSRAQVPSILRGIQRFHIQDRGWSDIGYNALIDRYGRVWEGRPGGVRSPHQGAHARGVNGTYLGFSYIGDTNKEPATQVGVDAMTDLIAWSSARYGFDPRGTLRVNGKTKPVVVGHYQVGSTTCPGKDLIRRLPAMRERAAVLSERYLAEGRARAAQQ